MVLRRAAVVLGLWAAACGSTEHFPDAPPRDAGADRVTAAPDLPPVDASPPPIVDAGVDAPPPDASCNVRIETPALQDSPHVQEGTPITYSTNPPSSGPHYPIWANFEEYDHPVEDGYLVHSMEHGAVLLFYDCDPGSCTAAPGVLEQLRAVRAAVPTDPLCDPSIRVRVILAPRPANDAPIAAAAWGATYQADCVDAPSLGQFIADHYAKAPEDFCSPGKSF